MFASKDSLLTRPSGYNIARSVRLRSSASAYFSRTLTTPTDSKKFTFSCWMKMGAVSSFVGGNEVIFDGGSTDCYFGINSSNQLYCSQGATNYLFTTQLFRDPSAWYHLLFVVDTTQATATNRMSYYVNGVQVTSFSTDNRASITQNGNVGINTASAHAIGRQAPASSTYFDGYLTEINFIDGQALTPSSFGETDSITGVWKPKAYSGTYGTNGFELNFSDNSASTAATIGKDYSGNGNNWTPNNISVTAGSTYDSMTDVPTLTSATAANYPVLNPLSPFHTYVNITNGNLTATGNGSANTDTVFSTFGTTNSTYWEYTCVTVYSSGNYGRTGAITTFPTATGSVPGDAALGNGFGWRADAYLTFGGSSTSGLVPSFTTGDVLGFALNVSAGTCALYKNNTLVYTITGMSTTSTYYPATAEYNGSVGAFNFGQQGFKYTPPSGFVALNTYNLPAPTIKNGAAYMAATLYTGNGSTQSITNTVDLISFQPDLVWLKGRSTIKTHGLFNSIAGIYKGLASNATDAEFNDSSTLTAFNSNGFSLGSNTGFNQSSVTQVAWQWKAGTTSASNTNGSITSTVSAGATQGFSVVTYTGTGANATVGHGLGVAPSFIITKDRGSVSNWNVYHTSLGNTQAVLLNSTNATNTSAGYWNNTSPTSTVFSVGTGTSFTSGLAYCFAPVAGYSAFGSYTGNGSTDGTFVYLGFRPRFIMVKDTTNVGTDWVIFNTSSEPYNVVGTALYANSTNAESTNAATWCDILSNGFKNRRAGSANTSGATIIYMAFAENPFKNALAR